MNLRWFLISVDPLNLLEKYFSKYNQCEYKTDFPKKKSWISVLTELESMLPHITEFPTMPST